MPDLLLRDACADCGTHDDLYQWGHACDPRPSRWICTACHEAVEVFVGHIEYDELIGTMESDPWPLTHRSGHGQDDLTDTEAVTR